jgi:hypothetical protein
MWMRLAPRVGPDAKQQRGNRTYPRGFTTLKCKKAFVNGGHPELSDNDVPPALLSAYASFICAALQYLTQAKGRKTELHCAAYTPRGGVVTRYLPHPDHYSATHPLHTAL